MDLHNPALDGSSMSVERGRAGGIDRDLLRREVDEFLHVAAHDLQEPARQMRGFAELLARRAADELSPESADILAHVIEASRRFERLTCDLMSLYALMTRYSQIGTVDASAAFRDAVDVLAGLIVERGAVIDIGALPMVVGNHVLLARVFQNLIHNSLRYVHADPPRIRVRSISGDVPDRCMIEISDNGPGINPGERERIFNIFYRADRTNTADAGTGIGLAVARSAVSRFAGRIWVESHPGPGATFVMELCRAGPGSK